MIPIVFIVLSSIIGYLIGRFGHRYVNVWLGNPWWVPHHWITGLLIVIVGVAAFQKIELSGEIISFGVGHFISDAKDFLKLKIFSPDEDGEKYFWGID